MSDGARGGYSLAWFETFAGTLPRADAEREIDGIVNSAPPASHPRLLDIGCGTGRTAVPLARRGFEVTGIDVNVDALREARRRSPGVQWIALDQRAVGALRTTFDVAIVLWNSIGFGSRDDDVLTLRGLHAVLRPEGRLLLDLYHPGWLAAHEQTGTRDARGATIRRWVRDGRCHHRIEYDDGGVDSMAFNVYDPAEISALLASTGFDVLERRVRWDAHLTPSAEFARYQIVAARR